MGLDEAAMTFWRDWLRGNPGLLESLKPGSRVGLLTMDLFDRQSGEALVWEVCELGAEVRSHAFKGLQQIPADILFVLTDGSLEQLKKPSEPGEGIHCFRQSVRKGQILSFALAGPAELGAKGYPAFLSEIGMDYIRGCVG